MTLCRATGLRKPPAKFNGNQAKKKSDKAKETSARQKEEMRSIKFENQGLLPQDPLVMRAYQELEEEGFFRTSGAVNPYKDLM
eukprot:gene12372-14514_t